MEIADLKYPVGVQSFEAIRSEGMVYVDKTMYIRKFVSQTSFIFLSRPRRFGKSLFIDTLDCYFSGRRDLFKGLDIDTDDMDWTPRPVFRMSFSKIDPKSDDDLWQTINFILLEYEKIYGKAEGVTSLSQRFEYLIKSAHEQTGRKSLFSVVKDLNQFVYFEFVTGISRFSHTSLFSGANNLTDITLYDEYAGLCGITEEEFRGNLMSGVEKYAVKENISVSDAFEAFKRNYDGYHFSRTSPDIYNPYSLLSALKACEISDYWFDSGTSQYLVDVIQEDDFYMPDLECTEVSAKSIGAIESYTGNPIALMFEAGYLTIKHYDRDLKAFTLGLPNEEVAVASSNPDLLCPYGSHVGNPFSHLHL